MSIDEVMAMTEELSAQVDSLGKLLLIVLGKLEREERRARGSTTTADDLQLGVEAARRFIPYSLLNRWMR